MPTPPLRDNEAATLQLLHELDILDTASEPEFDALVKAASTICSAPMALISLVDENRQWFKAQVGSPDLEQTPRDIAFCAYAVLEQRVFEVPDATEDPRFADHPMVTGSPGIRFYAGAPLCIADGIRIGTLCVMDTVPRKLTADERKLLQDLAVAVVHLIENRFAKRRASALQTAGTASNGTTSELVVQAIGAVEGAIDGLFVEATVPDAPAVTAMHFSLTASSALLGITHELLHPEQNTTPLEQERVWKKLAADTKIAGRAAYRAALVLTDPFADRAPEAAD